jgi:hypothetical protein
MPPCGDDASCAAHIDAKLPAVLAPDVVPLNAFGFAATLFVIVVSIAEVTLRWADSKARQPSCISLANSKRRHPDNAKR